ncbi:amidohydrolase [Kineococcus rhizosphaerae]|uniref:Amidohydrolase 3 domain-containing protein n=1 Tax=Kineococcus rhizosphaerae TaxID=559628 RepID=A0A2T0R4P2_9ACTN|nr:amidohydrolase [Kineococcus rhizosphaerae]PRY15314.1 hypothetical protein CLV37_105242 [Kineococcus rhizosphaerae]
MLLDTILGGGRITTMDPRHPRARTIGFLNGRVVGLDQDLAGVRARSYLDVGGRHVVPGFIDAHCHTAWFGLGLVEPTVNSCTSLAEVVHVLRVAADDLAEVETGSSSRGWLVVSGFDHDRFGGRFPPLSDLDDATGDHPLFMRHVSGHLAVVNTAALRRTGVLSGSVAVPVGGRLAKDRTGALTGVVEETAQNLFQGAFQPRPLSLLGPAVRAATGVYAQQGITSFTDAGVGAGWISQSPVEVAAFQQAADDGALLSRAQLMPTLDALTPLDAHPADGFGRGLGLGVRTGFGSEMLSFGPVKVFLDGSLLARTAAVHDPYCAHGDAPGSGTGYFQEDPERLRSAIEDAYRSGWAVAAHAIGDRAVDLALDVLEDLQRRWGRRVCPNRVEHATLTRPEHLGRLAAAGVAVTPQASFFRDSGEAMSASLGPERVRWAYRAASFLAAGITVAGSSDRPVADGDPLRGMQAFVDRRTSRGTVFGAPAERLTPFQALAAYTSGAAAATGAGRHKGSLTPGKLADAVILSGDPLNSPDIGALSVEGTLLGGEVVHWRL